MAVRSVGAEVFGFIMHIRTIAHTLPVVYYAWICWYFAVSIVCNRVRPLYSSQFTLKLCENHKHSLRKNSKISYNILFTRPKTNLTYDICCNVFARNSYKFNYNYYHLHCVKNWNGTNDRIMVNFSGKKINKKFSTIMRVS